MGTIHHADDVPLPLQGLTPDLVALLGLRHWDLWINLADQPGGNDVNGHCAAEPRYYRATIELRRDLDLAQAQQTLTHELLHVVLAPMALINERYVPDDQQEWATDVQEQTVELLRRALTEAGAIPMIAEGPVNTLEAKR
jgi:hypothetical protein